MPIITLPDGSKREFESSVTVFEVAQSIGAGLAKAALAGKVNGKLVDTSFLIEEDSALSIVTNKDPEGLEVIRHSTAHLLAQATQRLFPEAQVTIGPVIENGFYYDFSYKRAFTEDDLVAIENKMREIVKEDLTVSRSLMLRDDACAMFEKMGEKYKVDIISSIPSNEELSFYRQGEFIDLCRGPHVPSTSHLKAFKLTKVAGAYWRGDHNNEMLQRIYGTAFANDKDLKAYLHRMAEAEKRDHRKLAKKYDLFHMQDISPGMVFWHSKGWAIYKEVERFIRETLAVNGYQEIRTPQLVDRSLWETSGHWEMFSDDMFTVESDERTYAVKPMNCPCHVQVFNHSPKSYRELPLRIAEFGSCHRNEPSGSLHGIMRVRNFVQDDAHIFCTEEQIQSEVSIFTDLLFKVYKAFGFENVIIKLSTRPAKRVGSDAIWDKAEDSLVKALQSKGLAFEELPGEGAFYGPKIEFSLKDCIGRVWQCGTVQIDFSMPERLGAKYTAEDGSKKTPVMVHRAILGSLERFVGILIEEYVGSFPIWLAPVQVSVLNLTEKTAAYATEIANNLIKSGVRALYDLRNEKIGFKIRQHTIQRVPFLLVVGEKELAERTVAVRTREGANLGSMSIDKFNDLLNDAIKNKLKFVEE